MAARFGGDDDLRGAQFVEADLRGARFVECTLAGVVMRGVEVAGADIDAPWLSDGDATFRVNGVDVTAYVEAELDARFPGRSLRRACDPDGLREAWAALERAWAATIERASALPAGAVEESVDGEWSFAQTLRHLIHATDMWFGKGIGRLEDPFHPIGIGHLGGASAPDAPYAEVLEVRAGRVAMVREFIATVTPGQLAEERPNPHDPEHPETVRSCLHVVLEEQWEHHRFAVRDLDTIESRAGAG